MQNLLRFSVNSKKSRKITVRNVKKKELKTGVQFITSNSTFLTVFAVSFSSIFGID